MFLKLLIYRVLLSFQKKKRQRQSMKEGIASCKVIKWTVSVYNLCDKCSCFIIVNISTHDKRYYLHMATLQDMICNILVI